MKRRQRLSASVEAELVQAAQTAVDEGRHDTVSAWVNDAMRLKVEHDRRLQALDTFLAAYEAEHGAITDAEMDGAIRSARARATVVRSTPAKKSPRSRRGVA